MRDARRLGVLLGMSVGLAFLCDWLFYERSWGVNFALFLFACSVAVALRGGACFRTRQSLFSGVVLLGALAALAAQPGPLVLLIAAAALVLFTITVREGAAPDPVAFLARALVFGIKAPLQPLLDARLLRRLRRSGKGGAPAYVKAGKSILNWTLPVAGSCVFLGLFSIANPVLSHELEQWASSLETMLNFWDARPGRIILWTFAATGAWALLRVRSLIARRTPSAPAPSIQLTPGRSRLLVRCMVLFNAVFAVQTLMDILYLYGGRALPDSMTYAEYAHRGAYPLIATALLAALFVLVAYRSGPPTRQTAPARRLVLLWLGQNILLTASSAWRLHLYADTYGLTRLRVAAALWMLLVAAGLVWIGLRILWGRSNRWLVSRNLITTAVVLYTCCFVNFEGVIAWQNVKNCKEAGGKGVPLDYVYLYTLGSESLPALRWAESEGWYSTKDANWIDLLEGGLTYELSDWRGWTYRRSVLWAQASTK